MYKIYAYIIAIEVGMPLISQHSMKKLQCTVCQQTKQ